ncbi:MAG: hypothetical protein KGP14_17110, partial [Betaproteobacteria bacterium]|nr:hypothetical protein [Betaproteobacteria bacterium]
DAAPEQSYIIDADVRASGEGTGNARASHLAEAPPNSDSGSFRKALGRAGTFVLIGVILLLLLTMLTGPSENVVVTPADPSADGAELANASAQDPSATSADQMLSQWAEFVTGQAGAEGFGLTDGDGHPGQFCSSTTGKRMFHFGGMGLGATNGIPIYDFFAFADDHSMDVGAFWFDRTRGTLLARNLLRDKSPQAKSLKVPNRTMTVTQIAPGIVEIGGIQYHSCVL